jgi:hypothetical protein
MVEGVGAPRMAWTLRGLDHGERLAERRFGFLQTAQFTVVDADGRVTGFQIQRVSLVRFLEAFHKCEAFGERLGVVPLILTTTRRLCSTAKVS